MTTFRYAAAGQEGQFVVEGAQSTPRLVRDAEQALLADLARKGLSPTPNTQHFLASRIAIAIGRDLLSKETVDLSSIDVQVQEDVYTLINIKDAHVVNRSYTADQSVGAIIADLRRLYNCGLNDNIILASVVNGQRQDLAPEARVGQLASRELYWDIQPYS